ncbi:MAG: twitching motility protein PilT [Acidimicrobiia bacterium]|nr:twitching motility protein PilT [Acidimicrobiia bacterium]NNF63884.1 twitching motility protein PilT [Acidimicrobiia bacterium]
MSGVTYDTGALIAAERNNRQLWALHRRALERGILPTVPATVLAQAWRGGPQPLLSLLLKGCRVDPFDEGNARLAGALLSRAATGDVVDGSVVVGAAARSDVIVTSDSDDLSALAEAADSNVRIVSI